MNPLNTLSLHPLSLNNPPPLIVRAIRSMNPQLQAVGYEYKVAPETEQTFDDDFFESLDMVRYYLTLTRCDVLSWSMLYLIPI